MLFLSANNIGDYVSIDWNPNQNGVLGLWIFKNKSQQGANVEKPILIATFPWRKGDNQKMRYSRVPHQRMSQRSCWRISTETVSHFCFEVNPPGTTTQTLLSQKGSLYCRPMAAWELEQIKQPWSLSFVHKSHILVVTLHLARSRTTEAKKQYI